MMPSVGRTTTVMGTDRSVRVSELKPGSVSRWGAIGQTLAIGPIFSAGFLSGTIAVFAGFNTPLSVLLAGVGMLALCGVSEPLIERPHFSTQG
jgi:hypothetical protein